MKKLEEGEYIFDEFYGAFSEGTSASCTATSYYEDPLTLEKIYEAIARIEAIPCHFKSYMISKGFDPKDGCFMLLPVTVKEGLGVKEDELPSYVRISAIVVEPTLIRVPYGIGRT